MTSKILVSVVMPAFNAESFIKRAIESVLCQTYTHFEFIIIDDGSNDNTASIVRSFDDTRIVFISRENKGISDTLNEAIALAKGKYIARFDSDDIMYKGRLEKQLMFACKYNLDFLSSGADFIGARSGSNSLNLNSQQEIIDQLIIENPIIHPSVFIKREYLLLEKYNPEFNGAEDLELWLRLFSKFKLNARVNKEKLIKYRFHPTQESNNPNQAWVLSRIINMYINTFFSFNFPKEQLLALMRPSLHTSEIDVTNVEKLFSCLSSRKAKVRLLQNIARLKFFNKTSSLTLKNNIFNFIVCIYYSLYVVKSMKKGG